MGGGMQGMSMGGMGGMGGMMGGMGSMGGGSMGGMSMENPMAGMQNIESMGGLGFKSQGKLPLPSLERLSFHLRVFHGYTISKRHWNCI